MPTRSHRSPTPLRTPGQNPSPGPSPERGGAIDQSPSSRLGKGAGGLGHETGAGVSGSLSPATVRDDALEVLRSAAQAWAGRGLGAVPVEAVWDQLWSILEDAGVVKKKKK